MTITPFIVDHYYAVEAKRTLSKEGALLEIAVTNRAAEEGGLKILALTLLDQAGERTTRPFVFFGADPETRRLALAAGEKRIHKIALPKGVVAVEVVFDASKGLGTTETGIVRRALWSDNECRASRQRRAAFKPKPLEEGRQVGRNVPDYYDLSPVAPRAGRNLPDHYDLPPAEPRGGRNRPDYYHEAAPSLPSLRNAAVFRSRVERDYEP